MIFPPGNMYPPGSYPPPPGGMGSGRPPMGLPPGVGVYPGGGDPHHPSNFMPPPPQFMTGGGPGPGAPPGMGSMGMPGG